MSVTLEFFVSSSDRKKINKNLDKRGSVQARLKEDTSIINPVMLVSKAALSDGWAGYNYAKIKEFNGRYYFIDEIVAVTGGMLAFHLSVDPLMSYAGSLMGTRFQVARSESKYSSYFIDSEKQLQSDKMVEYLILGHIPQDQSGNKYILTVAGG